MWIVEAHFPGAGETFFGPFGATEAMRFCHALQVYSLKQKRRDRKEEIKNIAIKLLVDVDTLEVPLKGYNDAP